MLADERREKIVFKKNLLIVFVSKLINMVFGNQINDIG